MVASRENFPLLAELLADQQRLETPVAKFSAAHDLGSPVLLSSARSQLIPLSAPRAGEQYAFEVELDSCTGCKACVSACHSLNGLDDTETWRDVGLVVGGDERHPFQQSVTTACHHCTDPACLNGCPVLAYEKDPVTGIVRHLDDQCIGCQYCILKCPYDAPKYNARLGIVRKCDLCQGRLSAGEAPACAQACPTHAIRVVTVPVAPAAGARATENVVPCATPAPRESAAAAGFLRGAPAPNYTQPTTRYRSRRAQPADLQAADAAILRPQPPHWPLAIMLTLLPLAVGCGVLAAFLPAGPQERVTQHVTLWGWGAGAVGLGASVAHLGQPRRAWRIFLGWRRSWLSREAMVFGAWFGAATASLRFSALTPVAAGLGVVGLFCSVMIYVDTRRVFWRFAQTAPKFFGGAIVLGAAAALAFGLAPGTSALALGAATCAKLVCEARAVRPAEADDDAPPMPALNTARLLAGPLRPVFGARVAAAPVVGVLLPAMMVAGVLPAGAGWLVLGGALLGELAERHLFFRAVDAPKMPGAPA